MRAMPEALSPEVLCTKTIQPRRRSSKAVLACSLGALGLLLAASPRPAMAQEDFSPSPLKSAMDLLGLQNDEPKPEIQYRERAPLVLPPGGQLSALPSPQESAHKQNPAWPKDPDVARRKKEAEDRNAPIIRDDPGRPLLPSELNKGRKQAGLFGLGLGSGTASESPDNTWKLLPSELGFKGWFNPNNEKPIAFTGEPERENLTQPPPGYQTPSPNAPYGVVEPKKETGFSLNLPKTFTSIND